MNPDSSMTLAKLLHDMGSPLTVITWSLEQLRLAGEQGVSPTRLANLIEPAIESLKYLQSLVEFAGKTTSELPVSELKTAPSILYEPAHTAPLLVADRPAVYGFDQISNQIKKLLQHQLASRSAVIHSQIEPILKDHDFSQLRTPLLQILVNLLNNSLEANASLMKISLKSALKYKLVLEVNDNGQGIPPDQLPQIFQTGVTTKPEPGHGLGLAIVHELVTKHLNGEISVSSTLGQETTFLITWPISPN